MAKGKGWLAERIIEEARGKGLPFREDPLLVEALMGLDLYQEVPEELYRVIAEIYAFLYELKSEAFPDGQAPAVGETNPEHGESTSG